MNQGDSTETDVGVTVTVGSGADAVKLEETIPEIAAGEQKTDAARSTAAKMSSNDAHARRPRGAG